MLVQIHPSKEDIPVFWLVIPMRTFPKLVVESRPATIGIIVQSKPGGVLRVVIQGFMKARFIPGKHVALDGFDKHSDGTVSSMPDEELCQFD